MPKRIIGLLAAAWMSSTSIVAAEAKTPPSEAPRSCSDRWASPPAPPRYPPLAVRDNHEGNVTIAFVLDESGHASDHRITASSQSPHLDQAAWDAVFALQFKPSPTQRDCEHTVQFCFNRPDSRCGNSTPPIRYATPEQKPRQ
ncbi:energy transducer TonB [Pseudomarimonas arenosa]|uniref:TonB family protein n=1 Tax=Pseudomarimonas arenosa TaxID=2774145 RepID=A0AAW3ZHM9_9GAMM|nr:TonB family protein [Pseudomarimonas arenosa]MBD8524440.1 TonB family protein [Pseudomarimonas arenosa]